MENQIYKIEEDKKGYTVFHTDAGPLRFPDFNKMSDEEKGRWEKGLNKLMESFGPVFEKLAKE